ncbi:hypothetical protein SNOG_01589 [Parastagonospora nodorum SN15]|uniref:Uncharacterized protein n=1 Tax=Phaeosphaeria nodorum (strain SN15 / ATCC MYA-4574 / FGSC 10173) TaxID=321614 RepID=Q0V325_PHANO|nr:hypothetical protein SNOG_01589 [Parastagonospora nodorum SN15]EAT91238.1 hypothetical protein SNOG_01589 [Parastagonospora nodorum SN15]
MGIQQAQCLSRTTPATSSPDSIHRTLPNPSHKAAHLKKPDEDPPPGNPDSAPSMARKGPKWQFSRSLHHSLEKHTPAHPTRAVGDANTTRRTGSEFGALIPISTAPSPRSFGPCYTDSGHDLKARMIRPSEPSRRVKVGSVVRWIGAGLLGKLDRVHDSENKQKQR